MDKYSYLSNADVSAIDELYKQYKENPESVDFGWRKFFEGFEFHKADFSDATEEVPEDLHKEFKVINLINGYRNRGHLFTKTNPVRERRKYSPTLDIENFGLSESDLEKTFQAGQEIGIGRATLRDIIKHLKDTYCQSIGVEYMYIRDPERLKWIQQKLEENKLTKFTKQQKLDIYKKLSRTTLFEQYLQRKFVGQKRFSIEGGESLIPALDAIIEKGSESGVTEFVVGMAHRGRLNTLAHIFGKPYEEIFAEFEGKEYKDDVFDGDVKYHLGYSNRVKSDKGLDVHLTLSPNPSHLEAVDPVVEGMTRAKIDMYLKDESKIVPILIHGDAAIAGQGVVYEVVQMAQLDGYRTGGTIHIVVNNQIGFTTNYLDGRSSTYCTDVGKTTLCPVFHVNGDDVEAVVQTVNLAIEYRQKYHRDVFIDLLGYRKYGHNEGDEPKFTQPKLYEAIAQHPDLREIYLEQLIKEDILTKEQSEKMREEFDEMLNDRFEESKKIETSFVKHFLEETWKDLEPASEDAFDQSPDTGFDKKTLLEIAKRLTTLPEDKNWFKKVKKLFSDNQKKIKEDKLDWGLGEMLAYATLLYEGHPVRVSGQDVERGTFSHRHAVVKTEDEEEEIIPLNHIADEQAEMTIYNSLLSEYGVVGFDYGYAFACPNGLTLWEAQFGDFNNGAQIIIDQFLSSAEDKWRAMNGLVMLLPHGYEGMGSEHSSGRLERYLTLCAEHNMQICNATTPANYFHLLRRQLHRNFRKPLIVFTPKKLLRYSKATSKIDELAKGRFQEVLDDPNVKKSDVDTLAFCSGKIYYDILEEKESKEAGENIAVIRLEQLYPFPEKQIVKILDKYSNVKKHIWMQEEPENMGAWGFMLRHFKMVDLELISRAASGSPAAGSTKVHEKRHRALLDKLFKYAKEKVSE